MRIFVVEPDQLVQRTLQDVLTLSGHEVVTYPTLATFLATLVEQSQRSDVVLLGGVPVDGDTLDLLEEIRRWLPEVPMIALTESQRHL